MGNCCMRGSSSMVWAGDDWGSMGQTGPGPDDDVKEGILGGGSSAAGAELRIKVSKKQLEELLRKVDEGGAWGRRGKAGEAAAAERVLVKLIERSVRVEVRRRYWRPKLPTIPELD